MTAAAWRRRSSRRSSSSKVSDSSTGLPMGSKAVPREMGAALSPRPSSRHRLRSGPARRPLRGPEPPRFSRLSARRAHTKPPYKNDLLWRAPRALNRPGMARTESREARAPSAALLTPASNPYHSLCFAVRGTDFNTNQCSTAHPSRTRPAAARATVRANFCAPFSCQRERTLARC